MGHIKVEKTLNQETKRNIKWEVRSKGTEPEI